MELRYQHFLNILKYMLHRRPEDAPGQLDAAHWAQLFPLAQTHKLLPLFYEAACAQTALTGTPLLATLRQQVLRQVMEQTIKTDEFLRLYGDLSRAGYRPLVVKGILCRSLYPNPDLRGSSDEDLLVPDSQFTEIQSILETLGLNPVSRQEEEVSFRKPNSPLHIELHSRLFPTAQPAYSHWNQYFQDMILHSSPVEIQGVTIAAPDPTDHLLYLICHSLKHFLHSGFGIRQICDLLLFTQAHSNALDWPRILEACQDIHCCTFVAAVYCIGVGHLGFDYQTLGIPEYFRNSTPDELPLLIDILEGGIYGGSSPARQRSSNITLTAASGSSRRSPLAASLFPGLRQLQNRYPYLKNHPWLLPVAWTSRILSYRKDSAQAQESLSIGAQRLALLEQYDLIQKT